MHGSRLMIHRWRPGFKSYENIFEEANGFVLERKS
jgi:hypothetical protein